MTIETAAILKLVDEFTTPAKEITGVSGKLDKTLRATQKHLAHLKTDRSNIASFAQLKKQSTETRRELDKQQQEVNRLAREYNKAKKPTAKLSREFTDAKKKAAQLKQQHNRQVATLEQLRRQLKKASIDTRKLSQHDRQLAREMEKANKQIRAQAKLLGSLKAVSEHAKQMSMHLKKAGWYGAKLSAAVTALGYVFKRTFVDSASQFERFRTVLTTLNNGDVSKAQKEFEWINKFVAQTPYQIEQVTEAFVKLRAYGIDPTTGSARILGDAAALDKDYLQAVEAIADALNGENERLKEAFNIKASVDGNEIVYRYTDIKTGMEATARAARDSPKDIEATLMGVLEKNYAGAMADQVKTWGGMVSLVGDQWTRFVNMVMDNGLFDWMKGELGAIIKQLDEMAANGELEAFAKEFAKNLKLFMQEGWEVLKALAGILKEVAMALKWAADALGGWNNLAWVLIALPIAGSFLGIALSVMSLIKSLKKLGIIGGRTAGKMGLLKRIGFSLGKGLAWVATFAIKALSSSMYFLNAFIFPAFSKAAMWIGKTVIPFVGKAVLWLGRALMANPIGLAITAIAGGAYLIIKYWEPIKGFFTDLWESMREPLMFAYDMVMKYSPFGLLLRGLKKLKGYMKGLWGGEEAKVAVETTKNIKQLPANDPYYRADIKPFVASDDKKAAAGSKSYTPLRQTNNASKSESFYSNPTIHIHAAPSMSPEELERITTRAVDKANRQAERRQRGRLHEG
ncbi:hypothetical protein AB835_11625 [Candidatus Endobugula sertula]|uniref:Phage tail tape measure protein n=1 Tax=Candidatus Endobugula sertula TaxID=62101 RepID=A0A1D2QMW7_9GAMM|nr:hypothetical protein AB835_11625 [Candidatus Endobugula sertula]